MACLSSLSSFLHGMLNLFEFLNLYVPLAFVWEFLVFLLIIKDYFV
jgi:hypothetical protein